MVGAKLNTKVAASSLLEVIISMVIIIVVFGLALAIFANVTRSSLSAKQVKAQFILNNLQIKAQDSTGITTQTYQIEGWTVEQEIKPYEAEPALNELDLTVYDENRNKIAGLQKLIILKQ